MKKKLLGFLFVFSLVLGFSVFAREPELTDIRIRFCNDKSLTGGSKTLSLEADPEKDTPLCVYLINKHTTPVSVKLNFVDGILTNDAQKNKACKNEDQRENFGQYVSLSTGSDSIFTLSGRSITEKEFMLKYPEGYAGKIYGCATLSLIDKKTETDTSMFTVLNRLGYPIEVLVNGELVSKLTYKNISDDGTILYNGGKFAFYRKNLTQYISDDPELKFQLLNQGNIRQDAKYIVTLNSFSHKDTIITGDVSVLPGNTATIMKKINLPWWDFPLKVNIDVEYTPYFDFESDAITDDMRTIKKLSSLRSSGPIILLSQQLKIGLLAVLFVFLSLIFVFIFRRKRKNTNIIK